MKPPWPHPLLAREGWPFVAVILAAALAVTWFFGWWSLPLWLAALFVVQLFRDPPREVPDDPRAVVSPADGLVVSVGVATNKLCAKVASDLRKPDALVVVPPGSPVDFLNSDPLLHNVFSPPGPGPGFNLGVYPRLERRTHRFDEPGGHAVLCHVHPEMLAYVVVIPVRHWAPVAPDGRFRIDSVTPGRYRLQVWHRRLRFPAEEIHPVRSATIGSRNPLALLRSFVALWTGFRQASALIGRLRPAAVVGFGGYPTLPPVYAAIRRGVPSVIHEQNAVMGRANRALAARVNAIAGGFLASSGPHAGRIVVTGNPVRPAVLEASGTPYKAPTARGRFRLLVFGGSQGAQYFAEAVPAALALLPESLRKRMEVVQQARPDDEAAVRSAYEAMGISARISPFFSDLASHMAKAHLVISRSGASTVSEIAVIGRPAILVPYPHALDHDQAANAAALASEGGAEVHQQLALSPERLSAVISELAGDPKRLSAMAGAARAVGRPEAVRLLADLVEAISGRQTVAEFRQGAAS